MRRQAESVPSAVLDGLGMSLDEGERLHRVLAGVITANTATRTATTTSIVAGSASTSTGASHNPADAI